MMVFGGMKGVSGMLIVAFICFLALLIAWLLVPTARPTDAHAPAAPRMAAEAAGD
jgi:hypothetical protein